MDETAGTRIKELRLREMPFLRADVPLYDVLKIFRFGRKRGLAAGRSWVLRVPTWFPQAHAQPRLPAEAHQLSCPPLQRPADMACLTKVSTDLSAGKASPMRLAMFRRASPLAAPGEQQVGSASGLLDGVEKLADGGSAVVQGAADRRATQQRLALQVTCFRRHVALTLRCSTFLSLTCVLHSPRHHDRAGGGGCGHHHD